jgi:hypothetical protein
MEGFVGHAVSVFLAFFAIMNPVAKTCGARSRARR